MSEPRTEFGPCLRCIDTDSSIKRICRKIGICAACARAANASFAVDIRAAIARGEKVGGSPEWADANFGPEAG